MAVFALALCACSKDDGLSVNKSNLSGRWEVYKAYYYEDGEGEWDYEYGEKYGYRDFYQFNTDGTGSWTERYKLSDDTWNERVHVFDYSISGNILTILFYDFGDGDRDRIKVVSLSHKELVIETDYGHNEYDRYYMKRI